MGKTARGEVLQLGTRYEGQDESDHTTVGVLIRMHVTEARKLGLYTLVDIRPVRKAKDEATNA
jgi:hypothetical protein